MYGEDIDLSVRILQAGFKNYYFPETTIIHYKGKVREREPLTMSEFLPGYDSFC